MNKQLIQDKQASKTLEVQKTAITEDFRLKHESVNIQRAEYERKVEQDHIQNMQHFNDKMSEIYRQPANNHIRCTSRRQFDGSVEQDCKSY